MTTPKTPDEIRLEINYALVMLDLNKKEIAKARARRAKLINDICMLNATENWPKSPLTP